MKSYYWQSTFTIHSGHRLEYEVEYDHSTNTQIYTGKHRYVSA